MSWFSAPTCCWSAFWASSFFSCSASCCCSSWSFATMARACFSSPPVAPMRFAAASNSLFRASDLLRVGGLDRRQAPVELILQAPLAVRSASGLAALQARRGAIPFDRSRRFHPRPAPRGPQRSAEIGRPGRASRYCAEIPCLGDFVNWHFGFSFLGRQHLIHAISPALLVKQDGCQSLTFSFC